jgi:SAM-dependent methyltransferase
MPVSDRIAAFWDEAADGFDAEPDHGLRDAAVRDAWTLRLRAWLPPAPSDVLDLGCGTGSLALLAVEAGHRVVGVDLSLRMVERARAKLARSATVLAGDAADPPVGDRRFDVVLVRHVVWTLPDPHAALRRWVSLLRPDGRLLLIEGRWGRRHGFAAVRRGHRAAPLAGRRRGRDARRSGGAAVRAAARRAARRPRALGPPDRRRALRAHRGPVLACDR